MPEQKEIKPSSFAWLNLTQFLGALNDNVFKLLVVFFLVEQLKLDSKAIVTLASAIFVLPFLLFSHAAGVLADRFSKRHIIVGAKVAEACVMILGVVGVYLASPGILLGLIFVMCMQSAIFGPSKYGIIPELVRKEKLSEANSFLVSLTYLAIILGTFLPSFFLVKLLADNYLALGLFCVFLSILGLIASLRITTTPAAGTQKRFTPWFVVDIFRTVRGISSDRDLILAVLGSAYFLFLGAFIQQNVLLYGESHMSLTVKESGFLFPMAALGIGIGALLSGRVSGRNIEFGIVPVGAIGLTLCTVVLGVIPPSFRGVLVLMFLLGLSSGLFIVPLNAFIQYRSPKDRLGEILACSNFLSFLGVALSAALVYLLTSLLGVPAHICFIIIGVFTALLAVVAVWILPDFLVRFAVIFVTKIFYRITARGLENLPLEGGALLVSNHVTWVDALLISAPLQRRVRFVMARDVYDTRWIRPLFKLMGVIPISPSDPPRQVIESFRAAREALDAGYLVCIFAEGAITRNGNMHGFKPGFERIVKGSNHPVIPIHIGGAWGSIFSYYSGNPATSLPRRIPYTVSVLFGERMPSSATVPEARQAVSELSVDAFNLKRNKRRTLGRMFLRKARRSWTRHAVWDTTGKSLTFGRTLVASIALADEIEKLTVNQDKIGVVLPSSVAGVLSNAAITLLGKIPVNLNFTASAEAVASAIEQCGIETTISSRAFLDKLGAFEQPEGLVCLEDVMTRITRAGKLRALMKALFASPRTLARGRVVGPDDTAAIIFSSGSTAEPKGVMLSHHNLISDIESTQMVFKFERTDRFCSVLPFFHSFGFTVTLWCPLVCGFAAYYHANPLDAATVGGMSRENHLTAMVATPTFLLSYIRRAKPEDFKAMRAVITGAEKLKTRVADAFEKRFGIRPVEGYGATELSPVAAMNVPDVCVGGVKQIGSKEGSVGHPVPGVAVRIVDPEALTLLPNAREGLLEVRGENVMVGYLGKPDKTAEVLRNGWYNTGDIARVDSDGFLFLLDRMSRYSKIGGEMVPHIAVEEELAKVLGSVDPVAVVTAAPDEKKGEQLVVCFTDAAGTADSLFEIITQSELPNLWKPRKDNFVRVDGIPTLGSGKLDLKGIKGIARQYVESRPGPVQRAVEKIREAL